MYLREIFQVQAPGGLYLEGRFNAGFFVLPVCGAYIWRGLYMEELIFGILRYLRAKTNFSIIIIIIIIIIINKFCDIVWKICILVMT